MNVKSNCSITCQQCTIHTSNINNAPVCGPGTGFVLLLENLITAKTFSHDSSKTNITAIIITTRNLGKAQRESTQRRKSDWGKI